MGENGVQSSDRTDRSSDFFQSLTLIHRLAIRSQIVKWTPNDSPSGLPTELWFFKNVKNISAGQNGVQSGAVKGQRFQSEG